MFDRVLAPIKTELQQAQNILARSCQIRNVYLSRFIRPVADSIHNFIRPALVLLSARLFAPLNMQAVALAAVIQLIYLATCLHRNVQENTVSGSPRDGYQFPVLVGDYFYSCFFTCLCEHGVIKYLEPLSKIICEINEGGLLRIKNEDELQNTDLLKQIVFKETAILFGGGCRLAGDLTGATKKEQDTLEKLGVSFGMALGLSEYALETGNYYKEALTALTSLPPGENRDVLEKLICFILEQNMGLALQLK
ncbi:heptaprenyl diphosphate synthase component 1 [Desulfofundulus thermocisternus]|uniref:heptaprenyl diphosphate synthase component 1 n=1 Tax=Desulfofundulus thermocisternus TaxID=42471 RepID=UPI001A064B5E|nr:polyprenyl synthetase family protein [Desulfofundulus thermocisternus]MBE3585761.1 polyprenyl synthetase family protein [Thermoanaerobacter sp.]MCS5696348.1 polyprenyl synthetase family protein [Desulfofundulus thermocisternus]